MQVDASGNSWVAGWTKSRSLDGHNTAGFSDVFLMQFDHAGVHQWTVQRGGSDLDVGNALQAQRGGRWSMLVYVFALNWLLGNALYRYAVYLPNLAYLGFLFCLWSSCALSPS